RILQFSRRARRCGIETREHGRLSEICVAELALGSFSWSSAHPSANKLRGSISVSTFITAPVKVITWAKELALGLVGVFG
ncbi:hypothetical protein, partial [Agrobacterium sp. MCAB5]|uniref:hypothetical protein n=1 Tax=Agrobacterium sp. MCAB5 TaxID=3233042 RepID=UPI003F939BAE